MGSQLLFSLKGEVKAYGHFFENVTNVKDLLDQVKSGQLNICLVNPSLIIDVFQLQVAISRAAANRAAGQMVTKNIYSEILYCLSPSKNIVESFKLFGTVETCSSLIAVTFDICEQISDIVKGSPITLKDGVEKNRQISAAKKVFKIRDSNELPNLVNLIVTKIATKHLF